MAPAPWNSSPALSTSSAYSGQRSVAMRVKYVAAAKIVVMMTALRVETHVARTSGFSSLRKRSSANRMM